VQSRNAHGLSGYSATLSLLCAIKPSIPSGIISYNVNANVVIEWTAPADNGSPITAYRIVIETNSGTYSEELNNCDGTDSTIVAAE
jgi:hypothetical protein